MPQGNVRRGATADVFPGVASRYERLQIEPVLGPAPARVERGAGLVLLGGVAGTGKAQPVYRLAIEPALDTNGVNVRDVETAFDDAAKLAVVAGWVRRAEVIVADVSELNPVILYVLGLCHGLSRCPLLVGRADTELPFDLASLRYLRYVDDRNGLLDLREELTRAVRVFLSASRVDSDVT